jgi:hypothetical protein
MAWVALSAAIAVLGGCGGSSASDQTAKFKQGYASVSGELRQTSVAIGKAIQQAGSRTDAQIAATFHQLATRWQNALSQLETLKPPADLATAFHTVSDGASRAETDLNAIVSAAATHSKSAATQAAGNLVSDITTAKSASTKITQKLGIK